MREQLRVVLAVARDPVLARIELAYLGFNMAEYATWMAILVYAYGIGGAGTAALFAVIQLAPSGLVAPFAAFAGDRFRRDRVLLAGYLLQAVSLAGTAVALYMRWPVVPLLVVATAASASFTITRPVQAVILPRITHAPADLTAANAVSGLAESVAIFVGPFIGGLLLLRNEPADVFAFFGVVTFVGAILVAGLRVEAGPKRSDASIGAREILNDAFGGFAVLRHERRVLMLVLVLGSSTVLVGALDILLVAAAIDLLHAGPSWAGYLGSAFGFGGVIGAFATVALVGRRRLTPTIAGSGGLFGVPITAFGFLPFLALAPVLLAVSGAGHSISNVAGQTLLQRTAPEAVLARVFGVLEGVAMFALAAGSLGSGLLVTVFGVGPALLVAGLFLPAVLALSWVKLAALDRDARAPDPEALALLRRIPIFAPMAATSIERILGELTRFDAPVGQVLIREGEPGDRFYVVAEGRAEVVRDGVAVAERGPGEYFGEIALLRDVPRTATITALTSMRMIAIERDRFLEAVTGHARSHEHAEAIAAERS
ncbi:MAG TPA: MFS transporter [Candidatus Limnocylindrales bacterium]